jgi:DNA replication initiation complex subunit (GINS family)
MYNELYKAWKSEKSYSSTQPLPSDFYKRAASYLKTLENESASSDVHTIQGRLAIREKEVSEKLLTELRSTRLRKILETAKMGDALTLENFTDEERALARNLNQSLTSFKEDRIATEETAEVPTQLAVVRFLQDIPEIVGVDLKIYGPYKKEDVGSLPSQNAQALVRQGAAKMIEVRVPPKQLDGQNVPINNK